MMQNEANSRWASWHRALATLICVAFVTSTPMPGFAQQGGEQPADTQEGEGGDQEGDRQAEKKQEPEGPTPTLFLLPTRSAGEGMPSIVPERIGEMLRERVGASGDVDLLPTYQQFQKDASAEGGAVNAAISKAQKLYTSGIGLLTAGKYEEAADSFQKAVDLMKENIADLQNFDVLTDALSNLARAYYQAGYDFDARKRIKEFAHLRPNAKLDPEKFPKELRELYDTEVAKVKKAGTSIIDVKANVEGATVIIDGEEKGETPASIDGVGFGYHYLVVKSEAGGTWSQQIRVRGRGKKQTYDVQLGAGEAQAKQQAGGAGQDDDMPAFYTELLADIEDGQFGTSLQPYLEELSKRTGAGYVAWVVMYKQDNEYVAAPFAYRAEDGLYVQGETVGFNVELSNLMVGVSELTGELVSLVVEMPEEKAFKQVTLVEPKEEEEEAARVAAAGTTGESQETTGKTEEPTEEVEPIEDPDEDDDNNALLYVGIGGAALVAAGLVTGGVLLFGGQNSRPGGFKANVSW